MGPISFSASRGVIGGGVGKQFELVGWLEREDYC